MPSGGKREGAGRKRIGISEQQIKALLKAFGKKAKATGMTVHDLLAEIAYNNHAVEMISYTKDDRKIKKIVLEVPVKERLRAMEVFMAYTITKFSQKEVTEHKSGPVIGLPPIDPKPPEAYFPTGTDLVS